MSLKIFCNTCKGSTNHKILKQHELDGYSEEAQIHFCFTWEIIQCQGCDSISFRQTTMDSESINHDTGEYYIGEVLHPKRNHGLLQIKPYLTAPIAVSRIYRETIDAYNNGLNILCAAGLRATIESICNAEGIIDGPIEKKDQSGIVTIIRRKDLKGKINGLFEKGHITKKQSDFLQEHRFIGNDALHLTKTPQEELLTIAIEIVEHILDSLYVIENKAVKLTAQRIKKPTKKTESL